MNGPDKVPSAQLDLPLEGEVRDRSLRPKGVLPKNAQTYVVLAITVVMVGAIAFSGGNAPKPEAGKAAAPKTAPVIDPNLARIQEYRMRIEEQARKLAAEQAQLEQAKQALSGAPVQAVGAGYPSGVNPYAPAPYAHQYPAAPQPTKPEKDPIEADKEKRDYASLFASNVALSYRKEDETEGRVASNAQRPSQVVSPSADLEAERHSPEPVEATRKTREHPELQQADGKRYRLFEGAIIETVLTNRISGSFTGPVNCLVTTDVYSRDRQQLLIPKGSRILGEAKRNDSFGQQRLAVVFHRIIMPDGYSASLDQFKGLSQIGETGLRDKVNRHYTQVFGVSLAVGAIAGLASVNTGFGFNATALDAYRQGVTANLSQSSLRILDRYLNVLPTFTIREGHRIKVVLSDDLLLPAYARHTLPGDL